jgi:hypothetical protein
MRSRGELWKVGGDGGGSGRSVVGLSRRAKIWSPGKCGDVGWVSFRGVVASSSKWLLLRLNIQAQSR